MMKRLLIAFGLLVLAQPAWAACSVTNLQVKDNAATTALVPYADDGSGGNNCSPQIQIKQGGNVAAVTAAGADTVSNSTSGLQGYSFPFWFNGTTWDRARGDATNGAFVNVKTSVLSTGAATSANQSSGLTKLDTIIANTGAGALVDETAFTEGTTSSIMFGGYFKTAPTALTTGQSGAGTLTADRKFITMPYADASNFSISGVITSAMTVTTSTSLIGAPGAGLHNYITQCTFSNSHATQGTMMILQDGSGGTTIYSAPAAPAFGGATLTFPAPLRQPTANTALFVANVTTGANTFAACSGYKGI